MKHTPESIVDYLRGILNQRYSSLSKAVHHEFVIEPSHLYDVATVVDDMRDTIRLGATVAAMSHAVIHAARCHEIDVAWELLSEIQNEEARICP